MKEFFRPTKLKIIWFVIIFLLIFFFAPCSTTSFFIPGEVKWSSCGWDTKITYLLGGIITDVSYSYFGIINLAKNIYLILIFELVISYIISSLIVFLYKSKS